MIYYITNNRYPFEFYLTFGLFWVTLGEITRVIYTIRKEVKEEL
jgi:succinate-acetate transporter protein